MLSWVELPLSLVDEFLVIHDAVVEGEPSMELRLRLAILIGDLADKYCFGDGWRIPPTDLIEEVYKWYKENVKDK